VLRWPSVEPGGQGATTPRGVTLRSAQVLLGDRRVRSLSGRALLRPLTIARTRGRFRAQGSRAGRPVSLTARRTFAACA
jgi:hypothetical protein